MEKVLNRIDESLDQFARPQIILRALSFGGAVNRLRSSSNFREMGSPKNARRQRFLRQVRKMPKPQKPEYGQIEAKNVKK